jgi:hypothetical protein
MEMKLPLLILLLAVALALQGAQTGIYTIGWSYGVDGRVMGFRIHWGPTSGNYTQSQDVMFTNPTATNYTAKIAFPPGSFVVVTALWTGGETAASNEIRVQ